MAMKAAISQLTTVSGVMDVFGVFLGTERSGIDVASERHLGARLNRTLRLRGDLQLVVFSYALF